ncbi:MAG: putative phage abortive infection protein [bacterium]|nr:putative phage abortive infection protein [bacterium]
MNERPKQKYIWISIAAIFLVVALWWILPKLRCWTWRDEFAAAESLFTGLAFAILIVTAWMQKEELELQRKELSDTREVLKGQEKQLLQQNETLRKQRFENTFFSLLDLHHEIVKGITLGDTSGRQCFESLLTSCRSSVMGAQGPSPANDLSNKIKLGYRDFFGRHESRVGHYFRNMYNILKYVDRSDIQNRLLYTNLIRAQLSGKELGLLFYNCLSGYGEEKTKPLVERYSILKNVSEDIAPLNQRHLYKTIAFGQGNLSDEELKRFSTDYPEDYEKIKQRIDEEIARRAVAGDNAQRRPE